MTKPQGYGFYDVAMISQLSPRPSGTSDKTGVSASAWENPRPPAGGSGGPSKPCSASSADHSPLRAALPTLRLFAGVPKHSHRPADCVAALPSAHAIWRSSSAANFPAPAAAPNTPQVEVICQPLL